jgi:hypothetical protein
VYLIRQDGRQLRIWADEMDGLLYDFDLDVGSTLPLSWNNWNDDITVVAVDSVLIGGSMRARFELANSWAQYLIEGVGTSHGLFEPVSNFLECGYELLCYGLGNVAYYPGTGSCELIMALPQNVGPKVTIGPLLASDVLQVEGTGALGGIRVLDASGRVVLTVNAPERTALIDVSALPAGPYLITVQGDLPRHFNVIH